MSEWKDIASAPKDGTWVLLFSPDAGEDVPLFVGQWRDDDEDPYGGAWWEFCESAFCIDADPSHWMPLPEPPVSKP